MHFNGLCSEGGGKNQRNVDIWKKQNQDNMVDEIRNYQQNCLQHAHKMENSRLQKKSVLQYKHHGKRNIGRQRRRWRKQVHLRANGGLQRTGLTALNLQRS